MAGGAGHEPRLEQRVLFERHAGLRGVGEVQAAGRDEFDALRGGAELLGEDVADLDEFAFVVRGDDDLHGVLLAALM